MLTAPVFPKIESDVLTRDYGRFVIGAMEQGYGVTMGNALRRVLLSSLPGAAITSMRLTDVHHEFSDVPHVKEDVMQLMLNVKQIRMRMKGEGPMRMRLEVRGEGVVTAGDIIAPPEIEIINPDLYLFTTDSNKARLDIEFQVEAGPRLLARRAARQAADRRAAGGRHLQPGQARQLRGRGRARRPDDQL